MKKVLLIVLAVAACLAPAALADDPLGAVKADLTKLQADFTAAHDTILADAQQLQADATAKNKDAVKADLTQLKADMQAKHDLMQADWTQLHNDLEAARTAKAGTKADREAFRQAMQDARAGFQAARAQVQQALQAARAALQAARQSGAKVSTGDVAKVSTAVPAQNP